MGKLDTGLVSVTFRQLAAREVIDLVGQAGLTGIEWGGDIHVPHGDLATARLVGQQTVAAGLQVAAYGSYYRVSHTETGPFAAVLATAVELGAPVIRVWAGHQASAQADEAYWQAVVDDSRRLADQAAAVGITIAYEFHANTLTDSSATAHTLLERVAHPNVKAYWQPPRGACVADNLAGIETLAPWLHNIHLFQWERTTGERQPLATGAADWQQYLQRIAQEKGHRFLMLEFVKDDSPEQFLADAATLKQWVTLLGQGKI